LWQLAYDQLSKLQPADQEIAPDLLNEWAAHQFNAEKTARADELYKLLYENYPESSHAVKAKLYVAQGHATAGRSDEARLLYQALESEPKVPAEVRLDVLQSWMSLESHVENWKESQRIASLIVQSFAQTPQAFEARYRVGEAQVQQGQFKEGYATLNELRSDPALPPSVEWRPQLELLWAECQLRLLEQDYGPLRTALEAFLASNPDPVLADQAHEILGRADYQEVEFDKARQHLKLVVESKASEKSALAAKAQFLIGECFLSQKKYESAVLEYHKVYALYPFPEWQAPALHQIAQCDMVMNEWMKAKSTLDTLIKEFPDSEQARQAAIDLEVVLKKLPASEQP
jgi:TolA-binding protein